MSDECCPAGSCLPIAPPAAEPRPEDAQLAALAKALAHPIRVWIVRILAGQQSCVCGRLVDQLPVAQSTVSQHLKVLKEAGLVRGEVDGPRVCYCLAPEALERLEELVGQLQRGAAAARSSALRGATSDC